MTQPALFSKRVGETITVAYNFAEQMQFGETIPSVGSVAVSLFSGVDNSPSSILTGSVSVGGTTVSTKVTAGRPGVTYILTFHGAGTSGAVYRGTRKLSVLSDTSSFVPSSVPALTGTLPNGVVGAAYSNNLTISGGYMPYSPVAPISGAPAWMGFSVVNNLLTCVGTPDIAAVYSFSPAIKDAALTQASSPQTITITKITLSGDLGNGTVGGSPSLTYGATGGTAPYTFDTVITGLPTGTTISSSGVMGGTYSVAGNFNWIVRATDANAVVATLPDSNVVAAGGELYVAIDNTATLLKSSTSGASFTDVITTGLSPTTSNVSVSSAGGFIYHLGASNAGRISSTGGTGTFSACSGLIATPGTGNIYKFGTEWQVYTGLDTMSVSSNGTSFSDRTITGGLANTVSKPVWDSGTNVLAIGSGHRLMISSNTGTTFTEYTNASINTSQGTQFLLYIPSVGYRAFSNNPSTQLIIGSSATAVNSAAWSWAAGPETGATSSICHGVARDTTTGRIVIVLKNGHTWYSDNNCTSWTAGPNCPYAGSLNYPPSEQVNNMIFSGGYFYFCAAQGGGVNNIYRTPDGITAWAQVYTSAAGNSINSMCAFP